jgi:hypothetical protein
MTCQSWWEQTIFMLNNDKTYCSIITANHTESTTFMEFLYIENQVWKIYGISLYSKLNVKTSPLWLKPDSYQIHQQKPSAWLHVSDSCQIQTLPDPITGITTAFAFLATKVTTVRIQFQFLPHSTNGTFIQSSMTDTGYYEYIRSRLQSRTHIWKQE